MTKHVLVIDDEVAINIIVKTALELTVGWGVTSVDKAEDGLAIAQQKLPDLVLLDVNMPRLDGPSVFKLLQADSATQSIPVIFLTAKARETDKKELSALGVAGIIVKPFEPEQLATQIAEILGW